jgi:hypothetical protein
VLQEATNGSLVSFMAEILFFAVLQEFCPDHVKIRDIVYECAVRDGGDKVFHVQGLVHTPSFWCLQRGFVSALGSESLLDSLLVFSDALF